MKTSHLKLFSIFTSLVFGLSSSIPAKAEVELNDNLKADGLIDTYYSNDFNSSGPRKRDYFTQGVNDNEGNLNLAYAGLSGQVDQFHGRLALQYGTSVDANYSSEPYDSVRYIQEAYVGTQINDKLKLDVGIFLSHIGLESFISRDNSAYTRALVSEFSPYYQSGARLTYKSSDFLAFQLHLLNGWQNISTNEVDPALGTQVAFGKDGETQFIYNTFLGQRDGGFRTLQDFILKLPVHEKLKVSAAADWGYENADATGAGSWYGLLLIGDLNLIEDLNLVGRLEHYSDPDSIIVSSSSGESFRASGYSVGLNYAALDNLSLRTEYKRFLSSNSIFRETSDSFDKNESLIIASLGLFF